MIRRTRHGFTFVEILAAMVFMAIVMPVAMRAFTVSNRLGITAQRQREAVLLGDQLLNEMVATEEWRTGSSSGDFGEEYEGYTWELTADGWSEDTMQVITVTVYYQVQGVERSEQLSTLALETEPEEEPEEEEAS